MSAPYTAGPMGHTLGAGREAALDGLHAEARQALGGGARLLRELAARWRHTSTETAREWRSLTEELDSIGPAAGADHEVRRAQLEQATTLAAAELERQRTSIAALELAARTLESIWLFVDRREELISDAGTERVAAAATELRILEAQESERARLAQEIHDGPAQALSNTVFRLELIERLLDRDSPAARQEIHRLRDLLQREMEEVRTFIHHLQSPLIGELGLNGAIRDSVEKGGPPNGLDLHLDLRAPENELDEAQQTVVLRVAQEALRNIRRHARASEAWVSTWLEDAARPGPRWVLEVRDDGIGFPVEDTMAQSGRGHFGLRFMRERAELIGGTLAIESRPSGGTTVRLTISTTDRS
jgi:two-component system sensor histidine kinase DegS